MKRILILLALPILLLSCNSMKRLDRLANKHGKELTETISIDTTVRIQGVSYEASTIKYFSIEELSGQTDTTRIKLQDGTKVLLVDNYSTEKNERGVPVKLGIKRQTFINRSDEEIHILKNRQYKRISVTPPDKLDAFLANIKWIVFLVLGLFGLVLVVRKMFL